MSDPYLILHKVRGEPAFDVATKIMIGEEEGWIIPTSGHRAYPHASCELWLVTYHWYLNKVSEDVGSADWDALPDHYDAKRDSIDLINAARNALIQRGRISAAKTPKPAYRRC